MTTYRDRAVRPDVLPPLASEPAHVGGILHPGPFNPPGQCTFESGREGLGAVYRKLADERAEVAGLRRRLGDRLELAGLLVPRGEWTAELVEAAVIRVARGSLGALMTREAWARVYEAWRDGQGLQAESRAAK